MQAALAPAAPPAEALPAGGIKLEWIHGYRAQDTHSNCLYNTNGDICYPAATFGIMLNASHARRSSSAATRAT